MKKNKVGRITWADVRATVYLQCSRERGVDIEFSAADWRTQKQIHTKMPNRFFTNVQKQFSGGRIVFSENGAGAVGHPQAK